MLYTDNAALLDSHLNEICWTVFDLETTGIDAENDVIIEIAAVRIDKNFKIDKKQEFCSLVNPEVPICPKSTEIHGITDNDVASAPDFMKVYYDFADFARDTVLIAHNAAKDMAFLRGALSQYLLKPALPVILDSLKLSRVFYRGVPHDLESLSERFRFNKKVNGRSHRALPDAKKTALLFCKLMREIFPKECLQLSELLQIQDAK